MELKKKPKTKNNMAKKTKTLSFDDKVIKDAEELAKKENRSFNNWLETLMIKEIENSKTK